MFNHSFDLLLLLLFRLEKSIYRLVFTRKGIYGGHTNDADARISIWWSQRDHGKTHFSWNEISFHWAQYHLVDAEFFDIHSIQLKLETFVTKIFAVTSSWRSDSQIDFLHIAECESSGKGKLMTYSMLSFPLCYINSNQISFWFDSCDFKSKNRYISVIAMES